MFKLIKCLTLLVVIPLALGACSTTTKNFQPGVIPAIDATTANENAQTKAMINQYAKSKGYKLVNSGSQYNRVKSIVSRLSNHANMGGSNLPVYVTDAADIKNAFAFNSNSIVVTKALMEALNDQQLAVVLAHEVAHILGQHTDDQTQKKRGKLVKVGSSVLGTIASVATGVELVGDVVSQGASIIGADAFILSYGRAQEYEADHVGLLLMAKAGYDPNQAILFWENSDKLLGRGAKTSFLSSHPTHGNRKERLKEALKYVN